jgi:hypothetical protein
MFGLTNSSLNLPRSSMISKNASSEIGHDKFGVDAQCSCYLGFLEAGEASLWPIFVTVLFSLSLHFRSRRRFLVFLFCHLRISDNPPF